MSESLRILVQAEYDAGRFDGVALIARGPTLLGAFSVGMADRTFSVPLRLESPMPIASVTKQMVAVCVLQEFQQDRLKLDDPIKKHLPWLTRPWAARVTIRNLLTHTSGLPQPDVIVPSFYTRQDIDTSGAGLGRLIDACELERDPGSGFSYNNTDYILLGALLEQLDGKPLIQVLRDRVFVPSGMIGSGVLMGREIVPNLARDYEVDSGGVRDAPLFQLANFAGAGAVYSTAHDLWAFNLTLVNHRLLDTRTTEIMLESSPQSGFAAMGCWVYDLELTPGTRTRVVERHGAIGGYNAVNIVVPESGECIVLMCNISSFEDPQTWTKQGLGYRLLERIRQSP